MKEWMQLNQKQKPRTKNTDKPYLKAVEENHNWIYSPPAYCAELCVGTYQTISNEIAERLTNSVMFEDSIPPFQLAPLIRKLKENPELDPDLYRDFMESFNKYKNDIYQACVQRGYFAFNYRYDDDGEIIDYEEIAYKPHLDTSMMHWWDD